MYDGDVHVRTARLGGAPCIIFRKEEGGLYQSAREANQPALSQTRTQYVRAQGLFGESGGCPGMDNSLVLFDAVL